MRADFFEIVLLCHAALAQDSPNTKEYYINQILNYAFGHINSSQREELEDYLAQKMYLPPAPKIEISK